MHEQNVAKRITIVGLSSAFLLFALSACGGGTDFGVTSLSGSRLLPTAAEIDSLAGLLPGPTAPTLRTPVGVLNGTVGDLEKLDGYIGKWSSACLPYSLTGTGLSTIHQLEFHWYDRVNGIFVGTSTYHEFSDIRCKEYLQTTRYNVGSSALRTVMAPVDSDIPGYADVFSFAMSKTPGVIDKWENYMIGQYPDGETLRVGVGDTWFYAPSAVYMKQ